MQPGRKPRPTHLKLIDGNPGKRPIPEGEIQPEGVVERPKWLKGRASKVWDQYAPELVRLKVLTAVDVHVFGTFCQLAARAEKGDLLASEIAQFRALASEFGIGAASRARLGTRDGKEDKDPAARYLK